MDGLKGYCKLQAYFTNSAPACVTHSSFPKANLLLYIKKTYTTRLRIKRKIQLFPLSIGNR